jgi:IclR family KDG regulon transcriptional repressor
VARSVPAVVRALDVLELFLDGRGSLSAPEVAAALDLPRTTTHELLATLSERDYVERLPDNAHRFRLGVRVSELGSVYADALDVVRDGQALVEEVSARCGEICQLGLLDRRDVVYVARAGMSAAALAAVDSTPVAANPRRTAAVRTAAGRVLLAHLPRPDLDRRLGGGAMGAGGAVGPDSAAGQTSGVHPQPYPAAAHAFGQQIPPPRHRGHVRPSRVESSAWCGGHRPG